MEYLLLIKIYRQSKNITQLELARKCRLNRSYISQLENNHPGAKVPTLRVIFKIAKALEVCPHKLIQYNISCSNNCFANCDKDPFTHQT